MTCRGMKIDGAEVIACGDKPPTDGDIATITAVVRMWRGQATMAEARDLAGITLAQAAKLLGVEAAHLGALERREVSDDALTQRAAKAYGARKGFTDGRDRS